MHLYDMHTHILPEFDDGAKSAGEAITLIDVLKRQGVSNICLTPHFYTNEMSLDDFVENRRLAFEKFKMHIPEDVNVVLGTEVYVTKYLFSNKDLSSITYGKSRYILTEFPYASTFGDGTMNSIIRIKENYGLIPVIPHVERYPELIGNPSKIEELQSMGIMIQTNVSNYVKNAPMFRRRKLLKLISKGFIDIIGTDTHSLSHNTPAIYNEAIDLIEEKCGKYAVTRMMNNAGKIFSAAQGE